MLLHLIEILVFSSLLLLSFMVLSNPLKVNKKANFWFGIGLFLWATYWMDQVMVIIKAAPPEGLAHIGISFVQFFTPLLFYISVVFFTNPIFKFRAIHLSYFLLPLLYLALFLIQHFTSYPLQSVLTGLIVVHAMLFSGKAYFRIRKHQQQIKTFSSNTAEIDLKWLEYIFVILLVIVLLVSVFNVIYFGLPLNLYINIMMLFAVYFIAYNALRQKEIFPVNTKHRNDVIAIHKTENEALTTKRKLFKDEELVEVKSQLNDLINEKELYLDHDINLASLAEHMHITPHQLSYIINNGFDQNFFQFINGYRVEKAKSLLLDSSSEKLSILGIAFEAGFSSKTAFNTTFKKITGQTPSEFKKKGSDL